MSEYDPNCSSPKRGGNSQNQLNTSSENLDDTVGGASNNNSIIGKVKSRVSSILPTSFSKWFSPSSKNCDSVNGSFIASGVARRRRHVEIEDDEDFGYENGERDDSIVPHQDDYNQNITQQNENYDEDSNQSEDDSSAFRNYNRRPQIKSSTAVRQPPNKRSRYTLDVTNTRDSPLTHSPSIVSSTPAVGDGLHIGAAKSTLLTRAQNRFAHSNSYETKSKKEPDPHLSPSTSREPNTGEVIDLVTLQECAIGVTSNDMQSRRSLNIPSQNTSDRATGLSNLKRQTLSTFRNEIPSTSLGIEHDSCLRSTVPARTSTTLVEHEPESDTLEEETEEICDDETIEQHVLNYNGRSSTFNNKRQMLTNGEGIFYEPGTRTTIRRSSTSESSEGGRESRAENNVKRPRKMGLFNSSSVNSRNGSRTSSFGNGLNFYSHLDGRKSLFSGVHGMPGTINNSTLSLNCYNRRQFNASIYGSTSALSDSRLLDTFSPFYKGKTTYGGASAYNKHKSGVGTGAGASSVRITPTLIRPTSSLSTLSSSSNSLATPADSSAISTTAKRILDLIEEFSTPISEVNKMGNNLRATQQQLLAKSNRLSDADLNSTRALRLSQIRTPYMRPTVTLQPSSKTLGQPPVRELQVPSMSQLVQMKKMQSSVERSRQIASQSGQQVAAPLKPVPEYSLPTETIDAGEHKQQMHSNKMKSKTNVARITSSKDASKIDEAPPPPVNLPNIAFPLMHSVPKIDISLPTKSTLPVVAQTKTVTKANDVTKNFSSINNIGSTQNQEKNTEKTFKITNVVSTSTAVNFKAGTEFEFSEPLTLKNISDSPLNVIAINENFKFSPPDMVQLTKATVSIPATQVSSESKSPQLKKGSVLDALKEPFKLPTTNSGKDQITTITASPSKYDLNFNSKFSKSTNEWDCSTCFVRNKIENNKCVACETKKPSTSSSTQPEQVTSFGANSFGSQFKKSSVEWDCEMCMVRNKQEVNKCVACETPRKEPSASSTMTTSKIPITNSFGDAFKPKVNTWECPTCLINNKLEANECVACQTKKPGTTFKLPTNTPLSTSTIPTTTNNTTTDAGFKSIAAQQKSSKWECDACMTHNDAARSKCVCCEQAKPGTQTAADNVPKFSFGASSATKFNFGFAAMANVPKEDKAQNVKPLVPIPTPAAAVPATGTTQKTEPESKGFLFGNASASTGSAFSFGFKPITTESTNKPSEVNSSSVGFKFGISTVNTSEGSATTASAIVNNSSEANKTTSSATSTVTFSLPATTKAEIDNSVSNKEISSVPTFSFGSTAPNTSNSSASGGFSFGSIKTTNDNKNMSSISFTPTTNSSSSTNNFSFGVPATSIVNTTTTADTVSTTVKPLVNFSVPNSSSAAPTTGINFSKPSSIGGFAFGSTSTLSPTTKLQLGTSTSTTNSIVNPALTPPKTSGSNLFQNSATAVSTPASTTIFGSTSNITSSNVVSSTTTTPSTIGYINTFGSFGAPNDTSKSTSTPAFGAAAINATETKSFIFGSPKPITETNSGTSSNVPANNSTWPKSNFSFDSKANAVATTTSNQIINDSSKTVFGSFGTAQTANPNASSSIFGNVMATASTPAAAAATATAVLGNAATPITNIFATNSAPAAPTNATTTNLFSSNVSGNANATPSAFGAPIFGSGASTATNTFGSGTATSNTTFGNAAASSNATFGSAAASSNTTFGNAAASSNTAFGSAAATSNTAFGSATALKTSAFGGGATTQNATFGTFGAAATNINTVDGASAAKKSEPAFSFGTSATAGQSTTGGFNFGAAAGAVKPAFNFNASSQPTFNFTGAAELQTAKPFQFGAAPTAPVFNFSGGAQEATPNAPFQFSAGIPPANNIFAPAQTSGASAAATVRRKIRTPVRRITPR